MTEWPHDEFTATLYTLPVKDYMCENDAFNFFKLRLQRAKCDGVRARLPISWPRQGTNEKGEDSRLLQKPEWSSVAYNLYRPRWWHPEVPFSLELILRFLVSYWLAEPTRSYIQGLLKINWFVFSKVLFLRQLFLPN